MVSIYSEYQVRMENIMSTLRCLFIALMVLPFAVLAKSYVVKHNHSDYYLKIEVLKNRSLYFEVSNIKGKNKKRIWKGPMLVAEALLLDTKSNQNKKNNKIENKYFIVNYDKDSLCVDVFDKKQHIELLKTCPINFDRPWKGINIYSDVSRNMYGLGQYFTNPGTADGDLIGRVWDPLYNSHGNALRSFSKGANSYAMFPVLYSIGEANQNFLLFYNNVYKQMWSLNQNPYKVESYGDQLRWIITSGNNIKDLRRRYMKMTGKAPVPNKDVFGLWISEFGYESWDELLSEVKSLHNDGFPIDGAALDIQWFGGKFYTGNDDRTTSQFGSLEFDRVNFSEPEKMIKKFKNEFGLSLMPIEESYISKYLSEHKALSDKGYMAKWCGSDTPTELSANPWWGVGGMIDWTNNKAGDYWHDLKRKILTDIGITHHWTDLGEPEMYDSNSCYFGFPELGKNRHSDIHNVYNLKWVESIDRGYKRNKEEKRHFIMSRSGTSGIQRFGAGFWSGDIGANMGALTAHYNAQMHMSFSGIDYYGADIGGFHRNSNSLDGDSDELYTQWFANACLFDFPIRSHAWNLTNGLEVSPNKIGDKKSNLYNIRLRYKLFPYYYSLSHVAYNLGDPIISPMVVEFPTDLNVRKIGNQKMIGPYIMAAMVASYGETERSVYLPKAGWVDYYTGKVFNSEGEYFHNFKVNHNGLIKIPLLLKEGAIIPTKLNYSNDINISGKRLDGTENDDINFIIVPTKTKSSFTLFEDDGETNDYKKGLVSKILVNQELAGNSLRLSIKKTSSYGKTTRNISITIYTKNIFSSIINGSKVITKKIGNNKYRVNLGNLNLLKINELLLEL